MQGQQDSPLTERGRSQAQAVAKQLSGQHFDWIYSSDLKRVVDTAQPLAEQSKQEIVLEPGLRERRYGIFEGFNRDDMEREHSELYQRYLTDRYDADFAIPNAETLRELEERGVSTFQILAERHPGERLAIFSHGGILAAVLRFMLGVPLGGKHGFRMANGSISTVGYVEGDWRVMTLGEVHHLREIQ